MKLLLPDPRGCSNPHHYFVRACRIPQAHKVPKRNTSDRNGIELEKRVECYYPSLNYA
jgi:hypothetical protein